MLTDLGIIKYRLRHGSMLVNRGEGWLLLPDRKPYRRETENIPIPDALVALLTEQGHIKTELRLVGTATWIEPETVIPKM